MKQVYQGRTVYGAQIKVHLSAAERDIVAVSNAFVPDIALTSIHPTLSADQALTGAREAMPNGSLASDVKLVIYPTELSTPGASAKLVWLVELRDDALPARNLYAIDAQTGSILEVQDILYIGRNRLTFDAGHAYNLPGTLARSEGDGPTGDHDIDDAHDFAGATYDYYWNVHGRDSYDDQGAWLVSTAHYGDNFMNAFWNGRQMVYGDGFAVRDVVAHELTHAVTEHSAQLRYMWQSGALSESFSDILGAMVDRDDWLIGEDLPGSVLGSNEAIRDMADPTRFGQPAHTDDWVETCSDNQGVHTNSGVLNKVYYNVATATDKARAEQIFYRTLTVYLDISSSLEDARAAALQSAQDLYGSTSAEYNHVQASFNAVGLDGSWNPVSNNCICAATTALADETVSSDRLAAFKAAATLYRVRDELLSAGAAGEHYRVLYEQYTGRITHLLLLDPALRAKGAQILAGVTPGLSRLMDGKGEGDVVTQEMVSDVISFLQQLSTEDRIEGDGQLASAIEREMDRIEWDRLVGMTFEQAWSYIQSRANAQLYIIYLPIVARR